MHTTRPTRRSVALGLGLLPAAACASAARDESAAAPTEPALRCRLILVRHTEKVKDGTADPALSPAGEARALEFARTFEHAGVTTLLHSGLVRTRETLRPLSERLGLGMEAIAPMDADAWTRRISAAGPDEVIAVAGHSNTVPALAWAFGVLLPGLEDAGLEPPLPHGYLPHTAYDRVHVLTPGADGARLLELRYGAPS